MLRINDLHAGYGATPILFGVSIEVRAGEAVALLGKNGMGKTTLMKTVMGFLKPWRGAIDFEGHDLVRLPPHQIARLGVGFVPENRRIFPGLTVRDNLELGLSAVADLPARLRRERLAEVFHRFPVLAERSHQAGRTLSGGEQQMLAIGRVMMAGARIILMDEPTQGLAPVMIRSDERLRLQLEPIPGAASVARAAHRLETDVLSIRVRERRIEQCRLAAFDGKPQVWKIKHLAALERRKQRFARC